MWLIELQKNKDSFNWSPQLTRTPKSEFPAVAYHPLSSACYDFINKRKTKGDKQCSDGKKRWRPQLKKDHIIKLQAFIAYLWDCVNGYFSGTPSKDNLVIRTTLFFGSTESSAIIFLTKLVNPTTPVINTTSCPGPSVVVQCLRSFTVFTFSFTDTVDAATPYTFIKHAV